MEKPRRLALPARERPWLGRSLVRALVLLLACSEATAAAEEVSVVASGPSAGVYHRLGAEAARRLGAGTDPLRLRVRPTAGSEENLRLLAAGEVDFALAQQDAVREHFQEHGERGTMVRVVGRVFFDHLHIFVREPLHVPSAAAFRDLKLYLGAPASGTRRTARRFLDSVGVPASSVVEPEMAAASLSPGPLPRFENDGIDAAFLVTAPGAPVVCTALRRGRSRLFSLDRRTLRLLTTESADSIFHRQVGIGEIPAGTYPQQRAPVSTLAVPVLLLGRDGETPARASRLLAALTAALEGQMRRDADQDCHLVATSPPVKPLSESGLLLLAGMEAPAQQWSSLWPLLRPWALGVSGGLLLLALLAAARRQGLHRVLYHLWREERFARWVFLGLPAGIVLITLTTFALEHEINENFSNPWESFWSITVYLFSGLEDRTPYTVPGRAVATFGLILGPLFFALMTGWLASFFIQWEKKMPQNLKNHFLILNWNPRAVLVIRQLHHPVLLEHADGTPVIVVLTQDDEVSPRRLKELTGEDEIFEDFFISVGDPTAERALLNANAQDARSVIILADDKLGPHADERTLRSLMMLRRIARQRGIDDLHVIAELVDPANDAVIDEIAKDFPGLLERVSGMQVRTCLLAQAAMSSGIVGFYSDLLRVSDDTNEVYARPVPASAVGKSFREYAALVMAADGDRPLLPVGVQRRVEGRMLMFCNPRSGQPGAVLEEGDRLVLLAYEPPADGQLPTP